MKKVLAWLLTLVLLIGLMPMTALATEETETNPWSGRSAVFVGDSITAGSGTSKIYYSFLEEALGFDSVTAMGVGGSCISAASDYGTGNQPLINRYQNIPSTDLIVIFMGTNDYGHETPLGSVGDTKDGTFYGALNTIVPALVAKHTSSKIVFVTPLHRYGFGTSKILGTQFTYDNIPNGVGATLGDYVNALKAVCANNGVTVIDLYTECTLDPTDSAVRSIYIPDGLHPNAAGHELIAGIMESHIRSYEPVEKAPEIETKPEEMTELVYGNKFASGFDQNNRASARVNQYLKAGTVITLKDPDVMQWACAKTNGEISSTNLGYFPDSQWTDNETAVVAEDGWVGFVFKYRDETQVFDLSKPLSEYITIEEPHTHSYECVVTAPTCTEQGYTTYTCECGDSYVEDYVAARGHDYADEKCQNCGNSWPEKLIHFSFDDTIGALKDLTENADKYQSLFDQPFFKVLKDLHDTYGAVFSLYCFYNLVDSTDKTTVLFSLEDCTDRYAAEFEENAGWLRLGFHSVDNVTNYANTTATESKNDYDRMIEQILRITGTEKSIDTCVRLQNFAGNLASCQAMRDCEYGVTGLFTSDYAEASSSDVYYASGYYLKEPATTMVASKGEYYDTSEGLVFYPSNLRLDNIGSADVPAYMDTFLSEAKKDRNKILIMYAHENQMYKNGAVNTDYIKRLSFACDWALENGYEFAFPMDRVIQVEEPSVEDTPNDVEVKIFTNKGYLSITDGSVTKPESTWVHSDLLSLDDLANDSTGICASKLIGHAYVANIAYYADSDFGTWISSLGSATGFSGTPAVTAEFVRQNAPEGAKYVAFSTNGESNTLAVALKVSHTYTATITAPTCTEQGYTTYTCACGDSYVDNYVEATDHTYQNGICTGCGEMHPNLANYNGKVISVLGDSISTFAGYIPVADGFNLEHLARYPQDNLLTDVNETWWMQVINQLGAQLGINESWRSTEVYNYIDAEVNSAYDGTKACMASITRIQNLGSNGTPDVILFYGGTNDITQRRPVGSFDPATAPIEVDLISVKWDTVTDAYIAAIMRMQHYYPDAKIVAMLPTFTYKNTDAVIEEYNSVFAAICEHYGVSYVDLRDCGITTAHLPDGTHPNAVGMDYITRAVLDTLLASGEMEPGERVVHTITHSLKGAESSKSYYKGVTHGKPFVTAITGEKLTVTVTMNGIDITNTVYSNGIITIPEVIGDVSIVAEGRVKTIYEDHLQQLPENICKETNLWTVLNPENLYYTASGWGINATGLAHSVTIPIRPGDQLWATSFQKAGINGGTGNGIRLTWFDQKGVLKSLSTSSTYEEFLGNGYLTAPEGAVAVNVVMWNGDASNEVYILNREHVYDDEWDATCNGCGAVREVPLLPGDANGDGKVNNRDLGVLQQYLADMDAAIADYAVCDVNADGKLNNRDLGLLQQYLADMDVELHYGTMPSPQ